MKPDISAEGSGKAPYAFERRNIQAAFTRFLQETNQRTSDEVARAFALKITRWNTEKFRGKNEEEIYNLLTGKP